MKMTGRAGKWAQLIVSALIIAVIILFSGCDGPRYEYKTYEVTYFNGDQEEITYKLPYTTQVYLREGDIEIGMSQRTYRSGVRSVRLVKTVKVKQHD